FFKIAFVAAGCDYGLVCDLDAGHGGAVGCKGLLKADAEGASVISVPHSCHISSKVDQSVLDSFAFQVFLQPVRDITFRDAAEIDPGIGIGQCDSVSIHLYLSVIDMG